MNRQNGGAPSINDRANGNNLYLGSHTEISTGIDCLYNNASMN